MLVFLFENSCVCLSVPSVIWLHPGQLIFLSKLHALPSRSVSTPAVSLTRPSFAPSQSLRPDSHRFPCLGASLLPVHFLACRTVSLTPQPSECPKQLQSVLRGLILTSHGDGCSVRVLVLIVFVSMPRRSAAKTTANVTERVPGALLDALQGYFT